MTDISAAIMNEPTEHDPRLGRLRDPQGTAFTDWEGPAIFNQETGSFEPAVVQYEDDLSGIGDEGVDAGDGQDDWSPGVYFPGENPTAFPVYERASNDFNAKAMVITVTTNMVPKQLVGRTTGRKNITLSIPTSFTYQGTSITPIGCIFTSEMGSASSGDGYQLNSGDSITIATESEVWISPIPGVTSGTVVVQYVEETNPVRGSLGAN